MHESECNTEIHTLYKTSYEQYENDFLLKWRLNYNVALKTVVSGCN